MVGGRIMGLEGEEFFFSEVLRNVEEMCVLSLLLATGLPVPPLLLCRQQHLRAWQNRLRKKKEI